ncbi:unnamed protein product [Schistosoma curassoni]|uniref:BBS2_N domain-containing protein n=1 Tax=Schistosoma curassoni TaxID=6186 RepID=A0A183KM94_9TREM|nr:unnamed protein product [Schistosoma curassoni]
MHMQGGGNSAKLLLPSKALSNKHYKSKLIVADTTGDIHSFQYINGLKHTKFSVGSPITCICIGTYQNNEKQRIISVCHNFNISGFTLKGKQIFEYSSTIQGHVNSIENVTRIWEASSKFGTSEILSLEHYNMLNYDGNKNNSNDDDDDDSENTEEVLIVAFTNGRIELYKYDQHKYPLLMYETVSDRYVKKFYGNYLYVESLITVETFIKN